MLNFKIAANVTGLTGSTRVREYDRPDHGAGNLLSAGGIVLDIGRMRAWCAGHEI